MSFSGLSKLMSTDARLPTMPVVAARIIELRNQPNVELEDVLRLISSDPAIASTIMRYVNSPAYLIGAQVESLDRAVVILGSKAVMNIALSVSLTKGLVEQQGDGLDYDLFWQRSLYAATAVRVLGKVVHEKSLDELFVAALFQDIGMLALDCIQPDFYQKISVDQRSHRSFYTAERMQLGTDHAALGAGLLEQWNLHPRTVQAVRDSHNSGRDSDDGFTGCVIASGALADFFVAEGRDDAFRIVCNQMYRQFSIREPECKKILIQILAEIRTMSDLFADVLPAVSKGLAISVPGEGGKQKTNPAQSAGHAEDPEQTYLSVLRNSDFPASDVEIEGLVSRAAFEKSLKNSFKVLRRESLSVVFVSINNLRDLEETDGSKVAKLLLRVVGRKLLENIRVEDFATRYGDSFALLMIGSSAEEARVAMQRVVDVFVDARYTIANGKKVALSLNVGIAGQTRQLRYESNDLMLNAAVQALGRAKRIGPYSIRSETPDSHLADLSVVK